MVKRTGDTTIPKPPKLKPSLYPVWLLCRAFTCFLAAIIGSGIGRGLYLATADSCLTMSSGESLDALCVHHTYLDKALALIGGMILICIGAALVIALIGLASLAIKLAFMEPARRKPKPKPFEELP